jgi:hypothetical protein
MDGTGGPGDVDDEWAGRASEDPTFAAMISPSPALRADHFNAAGVAVPAATASAPGADPEGRRGGAAELPESGTVTQMVMTAAR